MFRRLRYVLPAGLVVLGGFVLAGAISQQLTFHKFRSYWDLEIALPKGATPEDVRKDIWEVFVPLGSYPRVSVWEKREDGPNVRVVCGPGGCRFVPLRFTEGNVWVSVSPDPAEERKALVRAALGHRGTTVVAETSGTIRISFGDWIWGLLMLVVIPGVLFASSWDLIKYYRSLPRAAIPPRHLPM